MPLGLYCGASLGRVEPPCATPAIHLPSDDIIMPSSVLVADVGGADDLAGGSLVRSMTVSMPLALGSPQARHHGGLAVGRDRHRVGSRRHVERGRFSVIASPPSLTTATLPSPLRVATPVLPSGDTAMWLTSAAAVHQSVRS